MTAVVVICVVFWIVLLLIALALLEYARRLVVGVEREALALEHLHVPFGVLAQCAVSGVLIAERHVIVSERIAVVLERTPPAMIARDPALPAVKH